MAKKKRSSVARRASKATGTYGRVTPVRKSTAVRKTAGSTAKLNLYEKHKNEYLASALPSFVRVGPAMYLAYDGRGKSGATPDFAAGIGAMYSVAFTMKMGFKEKGKDYAVTKLEALWSPVGDATPGPDIDWDWTLLIRVPPWVSGADVASTIGSLVAKGKGDAVRGVKLVELREDQCVQIMHVGSYKEEAPTIAKMKEFAARAGRQFAGRHHEIYLSDPRKVAEGKLRTILRQPVS